MHIRVKICGITTMEAVRAVQETGADAVGFVFAKSPRRVTTTQARSLMSHLPPFVTRVAVFRHPTAYEISTVVAECSPDLIQAEPTPDVKAAKSLGRRLLPVFHEGENRVDELKAYTDRETCDHGVLLEASGRGGRGITPDLDVAKEIAQSTSLILAGGLTPENVKEAILKVRPAAVDVSSGVESSLGEKDPARMRDFVLAVREAEKHLSVEVNK